MSSVAKEACLWVHPESIRFKDKRFLTQQVAAIADSDFGYGGGTARQAGEFGFGVERSQGKGMVGMKSSLKLHP